jgi:hypothetical protein
MNFFIFSFPMRIFNFLYKYFSPVIKHSTQKYLLTKNFDTDSRLDVKAYLNEDIVLQPSEIKLN